MRFSVTWRGPTIGVTGITAGDVLQPAPPGTALNAPPPQIFISGGQLGLPGHGACSPVPGVPCGIDVDALSFGVDDRLPVASSSRIGLLFSVDRYATGAPQSLGSPSVFSEHLVFEASADVYSTSWPGRLIPGGTVPTGANYLIVDGDGKQLLGGQGYARPGSGLLEPNDPAFGIPFSPFDRGDGLDALDLGSGVLGSGTRAFFSLAGGLNDPLDPVGSPQAPDSAAALGGVGGDIFAVSPGGAPFLYAASTTLGLDRGTRGVDDVDALFLVENGVQGYQRPQFDFEWEQNNVDFLVFSVRRGSRIVGTTDSRMGIPIVPGDLLVPPYVAGSPPGILVPAEALGLAVPSRTAGLSDDVTALDTDVKPFNDCNKNCTDDVLDLSSGASYDLDDDGIPDECQTVGEDFCTCPMPQSVCTNGDASAGCTNFTGMGGRLSVLGPVDAGDTFIMHAQNLPSGTVGLLVMGLSPSGPLDVGNGLLCVSGPGTKRIRPVVFGTDSGSVVIGPGVLASIAASGAAVPAPGDTRLFQVWYRDVGGPCGFSFNLTNGVALAF